MVPRDRVQIDTGLILRTEKSVLFVIPWGRHWIIGTTDTDWELDKAHPAASRSDIDYVLEHVNRVLAQPLGHEDVEGVYAGPAPAAGRRVGGHQRAEPRAHRRGAGARARRRGGRQVHDLPGDGARRGRRRRARPRRGRPAQRHRRDAAGRRRGLPRAVERAPAAGARERPAPRADRAPAAAATARASTSCWRRSSGDPELGEPLEGADDYLRWRSWYAAAHEGATHLDDVLARRTRISIETFDRGLASAEPAAAPDGRGARLGRGRGSPARSRSTASASRPSATRRSRTTTRPPTRRAPARRSCAERGAR